MLLIVYLIYIDIVYLPSVNSICSIWKTLLFVINMNIKILSVITLKVKVVHIIIIKINM